MSNRSGGGSAPVRNFNSSSGVSDSRAFQPEPFKTTENKVKPSTEEPSSMDKQKVESKEHSQTVVEGVDP